MNSTVETILLYTIAAGFLSIVYGYFTGKNILNSSAGNSKMQEIASAIQIGAKAYLARQYKTIAIVGVVVLVIVSVAFSPLVGLGYLIGATLSGIAGYVGMLVSVEANVRTAEASRKGLASGLSVAFKSGAVTGMLVAGLALLSIAVYYLSIIVLGFGFGMTRPALASSLSIAQTPENQGSAAGYLGSVIPIGHMTTPFIAMPIYAINPAYLYYFSSILCIGLVLFIIFNPTIRKSGLI